MDSDLSAKSAKPQLKKDAVHPPRRRARQQRTLATRQKILDAATHEFAKHGFEGATTPAIAAQVGVPHALITYHFDGKDGLWREVLRRSMTEVQEHQAARLHGLRGVEAAVALRLIFEDFIRFSARNPEFHQLMNQAVNGPGELLDWLTTELIRPGIDSICDLIRQAQQAERFVPGDPVKLYFLFFGAATRVFTVSPQIIILSGESPFSEDYIAEHTELCLNLFFR